MAPSTKRKRGMFCQRLANALDATDSAMQSAPEVSNNRNFDVLIGCSPYQITRPEESANETFRERLARNLGHKSKSSSAFCKRTIHNNSKSPFIRLPPEIRQEILNLSVEDNELNHGTKLKRRSRTRALVCKTMHADMQFVRPRWLARRRRLAVKRKAEASPKDSVLAQDSVGTLLQAYLAPLTEYAAWSSRLAGKDKEAFKGLHARHCARLQAAKTKKFINLLAGDYEDPEASE
ncbi:hypothetical protein LTR17_014305 [Elasticomyces elasticus]|nr:hypothetical protein LTR17_014305 [Elasticomyces elasticus]